MTHGKLDVTRQVVGMLRPFEAKPLLTLDIAILAERLVADGLHNTGKLLRHDWQLEQPLRPTKKYMPKNRVLLSHKLSKASMRN